LLYGDIYPLNNNIAIKNPSIQDIIDFGESKYYALINLFLMYPNDFILELYRMCNEDFDASYELYKTLNQYDLFFLAYSNNLEYNNKLMSFFFGENIQFQPSRYKETNAKILWDDNKDVVLDLTSFIIMSKYIMAINNLQEDKRNENVMGKMFYKSELDTKKDNEAGDIVQREKDKLSGKRDNRIQKLITKITIASSFKREDLLKMKVYEFHQTVKEIIGFVYWGFRMNGLYSGNVDISKMKSAQKKEYTEWFYD
jgi:hypothetical protein